MSTRTISSQKNKNPLAMQSLAISLAVGNHDFRSTGFISNDLQKGEVVFEMQHHCGT